jgi:hypothetical protein
MAMSALGLSCSWSAVFLSVRQRVGLHAQWADELRFRWGSASSAQRHAKAQRSTPTDDWRAAYASDVSSSVVPAVARPVDFQRILSSLSGGEPREKQILKLSAVQTCPDTIFRFGSLPRSIPEFCFAALNRPPALVTLGIPFSFRSSDGLSIAKLEAQRRAYGGVEATAGREAPIAAWNQRQVHPLLPAPTVGPGGVATTRFYFL